MNKKNRVIKHRTILNKKGQVQYFLENAFRVSFLLVALVIFFVLINFFINNKMDTRQLKSEVLVNKIIYSDIIMYKDDSNILHTGIIDMKKFNDDTINSRINYQVKRHIAAKIELIENDKGTTVKTIVLNNAQYTNLDALKDIGGKGGSTGYTKTYPVTYYDSEKYYYGTLKIKILVPNS